MTIGPREAKRMVVVSIIGTGAIVIFDKARSGDWPEPSLFVGLALTYIMLGFASDLAPVFAGPMALLFFVAVLLTRGGFVIDAVNKITGGTAKQRRKKMHVVKDGKPVPDAGKHAVNGRGMV